MWVSHSARVIVLLVFCVSLEVVESLRGVTLASVTTECSPGGTWKGLEFVECQVRLQSAGRCQVALCLLPVTKL